MTRLDLPDGQWADLANPRKVQERKRARFRRANFAFSAATADLPRSKDDPKLPDPHYLDDDASDLMDNIATQLILCLVSGWSYGEVTAAVLEEMPGDAYDRLILGCRDLATTLMPDYGADVDPKARTAVSLPSPTESSTAVSIFATSSTDGTS